MINGILVIGPARDGIPECLGDSGIVLDLPDRLTQATFMLPTPEDVAPWVDAIIRLWDDHEFCEEHRQKALVETQYWDQDIIVYKHFQWFMQLKI